MRARFIRCVIHGHLQGYAFKLFIKFIETDRREKTGTVGRSIAKRMHTRKVYTNNSFILAEAKATLLPLLALWVCVCWAYTLQCWGSNGNQLQLGHQMASKRRKGVGGGGGGRGRGGGEWRCRRGLMQGVSVVMARFERYTNTLTKAFLRHNYPDKFIVIIIATS